MQDILRRYRAIDRRLANQASKPDDDRILATIKWINTFDSPLVEDDPRVIEAQRRMAEHRHDRLADAFTEIYMLTEWQVLLGKALGDKNRYDVA